MPIIVYVLILVGFGVILDEPAAVLLVVLTSVCFIYQPWQLSEFAGLVIVLMTMTVNTNLSVGARTGGPLSSGDLVPGPLGEGASRRKQVDCLNRATDAMALTPRG